MIALTVKALIPVVLLIALGYALKRSMITAEGFWSAAERLSYHVLLRLCSCTVWRRPTPTICR